MLSLLLLLHLSHQIETSALIEDICTLNLSAGSRNREPVQGRWVRYTLVPVASGLWGMDLRFYDVSWSKSPGLVFPVWSTPSSHTQASHVQSALCRASLTIPGCLTLTWLEPLMKPTIGLAQGQVSNLKGHGRGFHHSLQRVHWEITCPRGLRESWQHDLDRKRALHLFQGLSLAISWFPKFQIFASSFWNFAITMHFPY